MTIYGYARVSTKGQSVIPQDAALRAAGADLVVTEKASGTLTSRPALERLLERLQEGDTLLVVRLDRLGRSLPHLVSTIEALSERGIAVRSLHEQVDTGSANGRLLINLFASLAQFERDLTSERTKAGLAAARAAGRRPGRPRALTGKKIQAAHNLRDAGRSYNEIASALEVSKSTVARYFRALNRAAP